MLGYIKNGSDLIDSEIKTRKYDIKASSGKTDDYKIDRQKNNARAYKGESVAATDDSGAELINEIRDIVTGAPKTESADITDNEIYNSDSDEIISMDIETTATVTDAGVLLLRF